MNFQHHRVKYITSVGLLLRRKLGGETNFANFAEKLSFIMVLAGVGAPFRDGSVDWDHVEWFMAWQEEPRVHNCTNVFCKVTNVGLANCDPSPHTSCRSP